MIRFWRMNFTEGIEQKRLLSIECRNWVNADRPDEAVESRMLEFLSGFAVELERPSRYRIFLWTSSGR
jgi:hypothetical protein